MSTVYLFDKKENLIGVVSPEVLKENTQDYNHNGLITGQFTTPYTEVVERAEYYACHDIDDPSIVWQYKIKNIKKHGALISALGVYTLFDDLQGEVVRDIRPQNKKAGQALQQLLEGTRWQLGIDTSTGTASSNFYYTPKLSAFWDLLETWHVEFRPRITYSNGKITGRYIDIADHFGEDRGKWYEHGDKLLKITATEKKEKIYTAFIGRGKGEETEAGGYGRKITFKDEVWEESNGDPIDKPAGQDYVEIKKATYVYGYGGEKPRTTIVDFPECEDPAELLKLTYEYALQHCRPMAQYEAEVAENELAQPGETVAIIRPDIGIRYKTRIFRIKRDFLIKGKKTISFGDKIIRSQAERIKEQKKEQERQEEQSLSWYRQALKAAEDSFYNVDSYDYTLKADNPYGLPAGRYSFNKPIDQDPTELVYIGGGKIIVSDSKKSDGSWDFKTFMTGSGLGAETVGGEQIKAGALSANDIYFGGGTVAEKLDASDELLAEYQQKLENLKVGGRNLVLNSDTGWSTSEYRVMLGKLSEDWHPGRKYTVTIKGEVEGGVFGLWRDVGWRRAAVPIPKDGDVYRKTFLCPTKDPQDPNEENNIFTIHNYPKEKAESANIEWIKIEHGTFGTDHSLAPEDEASREQEAISRMRREVEEAANNYTAAQIEAEKVRSQAYADNILTMAEQEAVAQAECAEQEAKKYMDQREAAINAFTEYLVQKYTEEVRTYIRTDEATGDLLIGKAGNPIILRQTNDRISFSSNGQEVAFFSNNKLYVTEAEILNSLILGKFAFQVEADSSVAFKWIGGEIA